MVTVDDSVPVCTERVENIERRFHSALCLLSNSRKVLVSEVLCNHIRIGDEIMFPVLVGDDAEPEIYVAKGQSAASHRCLYQAPIRYVTQPKPDRRNRSFVSAVVHGKLGISAIILPCESLRDYFYRIPGAVGKGAASTLYETLRIPATASPAELRLAYQLRTLEVAGSRGEAKALERAFNILGQPELRACYDALLADPRAPVIFPYGGFGSLIVSGERSRDRQTFFAHNIVAFLPEARQRRFHTTLRQCDFYEDRALCHDVRRKLGFWLDPALLHTLFDSTWNQWKHLLATKIEVDGTFIQSGKYRKRGGVWEFVRWETALPSRLTIHPPANFQQQVEMAKTTYHRFGQYSCALDQIRLCLEHRAVEMTELERICSRLGIPGDFDITQISWRPEYDSYFYRQLSRRARRIYLFRDEYIFDLEKAVVVETPRLGHATYVFAKPRSTEGFLAFYTTITKQDIRKNRENAGERLGFLGRVVHGTNPKAWLKEMRQRLGDKVDFASEATDDTLAPRGRSGKLRLVSRASL